MVLRDGSLFFLHADGLVFPGFLSKPLLEALLEGASPKLSFFPFPRLISPLG